MAGVPSPSPIAIVGSACRLPGAPDKRAFWQVLAEGRCVIGTVSPERWALDRFGHPNPMAPGRTYTWAAGQIDDVYGFDPAFFGISPREAAQMDPQQRLILQVTWEAFEDAGIPPSSLAGSDTAVFVGASGLDYSNVIQLDPAIADTQMMTGNTLSIISNRISYVFDFRGPSYTIDTACSSSLIAMHEALEAIRSGRVETAVVAGVNLLLHPAPFVGFARASMLSPRGLCRAFDAGADGYVRSEGAVVMILRRADVARADHNRIAGLVVGSGINCDGRTVGLSMPSAPSQARLLETVYRTFEIDPERLAFLEAHGTGTRVGDPIETDAIGRMLGQKRSQPLLIGSAKTNFGHLEPTSGLVGLLKAICALENDLLPASLHFDRPNPDIPFDELNLKVAAEPTPLAASSLPRLAGVNSFGFGGANAHVVVQEPDAVPKEETPRFDAPLLLSAESREALRVLAERTATAMVSGNGAAARRFANAAAYQRERLRYRAVVTSADADRRIEALRAFAAGRPAEGLIEGEATQRSTEVVFVYSGNGAQWAGMGRHAYQADRHFRLSFDRTDRCFMGIAGWSLLSMLFSEDLESEIERTEIAQPLLFAMQIALTEALERHGLAPVAVVGHSVGEVAAATVAGALSLEDGVRVIHARSTHQEITRHLGGMAAMLSPAEEAEQAIAGYRGVEIAAVNSPRSVTISGPSEELDKFVAASRKARRAVKRLELDYPFHCALVEPIKAPLVKALADIAPRPTERLLVSTVSAGVVDGTTLDADYWWDNVRRPVSFKPAIETLLDAGHRLFVEIGPRPVLTGYINDIARARDVPVRAIASLKQTEADDPAPVRAVVVEAVANGAAIDDEALFGQDRRCRAELPNYPWQNQPYRFANTPEEITLLKPLRNKLLGWRLHGDAREWFNVVDVELFPWLADHKVEDVAVFPAAAFIELMLAAGRDMHGADADIELSNVEIFAPLVLEEKESREIRTVASGASLMVMSRPRLAEAEWTPHAKCEVRKAPLLAPSIATVADAGAPVTAARLYQITEMFGLRYGPVFRRAHRVALSDRSIDVTLSPPDPATALLGLLLDPTLLDSCFHALFAFVERREDVPKGVSVLPVRFAGLRLAGGAADPASARLRVVKASSEIVEADFDLFDAEGAPVATVTGARFQMVPLAREESLDKCCYRIEPQLLARRGDLSGLAQLDTPAPRQIAERLELLSDAESELDDAALLLEIAVRRAALDCLIPLFPADTGASLRDLIEAGRIAASATPLVASLLSGLEETGFAHRQDEDVWHIEPQTDLPTLADIVQTLTAEFPTRIAEIGLVGALPDALARVVADGLLGSETRAFSTSLLDHFLTRSPSTAPLSDAIERVVRALHQEWPREAPLRVLLVGATDPTLIARLAALGGRTLTLTVVDANDVSLERARLRFTAADAIEWVMLETIAERDGDHAFDLVISAGGLSLIGADRFKSLLGTLAADGQVFAVEPLPSLVRDAIFGLSADWWAQSADPEWPIGPLATAPEWSARLATAGLGEVSADGLATPLTDAVVLSARRTAPLGRESADQSERPAVILLRDGTPRAGALVDAFRSLLAADGIDAPAADLPAVGAAVKAATPGEEAAGAETSAGDASPAIAPSDHPGDVVIVVGAEPAASATDVLADLLDRLGAFLMSLGLAERRVWIVTRGARAGTARGAEIDPLQAAVWHFGRVAMNEFPHLALRLVDIAPQLAPGEAASRLSAEFARPNDEREIVLDIDRRCGLRFVPARLTPRTSAGAARQQLAATRRGSIDSLAWQAAETPPLAPDAIEIEVIASGLNFRDVMWTVGLLPYEALEDGFAGPTLGMECAGRVSRVGASVTSFTPGDLVLAFAPQCFATHVVVAEDAAVRLPREIDPLAAATIPVAFLTAYYALVELGRLGEGDSVLIHGGAGGVGLAALQIARWRGARVFVTAGTAEKRALLAHLGADLVLDSRSLGFADEIRRHTGGEGVDVVLNSLAGEAMERSLDLLKPFGRFLELGKRDFYANTPVGLRPFRQNLSYYGIDADQLLTRKAPLARRMFGELMQLFADGVLTPLPYRAFDADAASDAFRLMQQSGHIGKIVLRPPAGQADAEPASPPAATRIAADATYLIAGGTGGFGFATAKWLAAEGARHLVLVSRSGKLDAAAESERQALREAGVTVRVEPVDITDRAAVQRLVEEIEAQGPPLKGVFHTAMVLDDSLLANLDRARYAAVLAPKVAGIEALDAATAGLDLDLLVMFSSITTAIGNPGQANYVAANAYLEAVAHRRRAAGKPALAIGWGPIGDVGVIARDQEVSELIGRKIGRNTLHSAEALAALGELLKSGAATSGDPVVFIGRLDWAVAAKDLAVLKTPLFARISVEAAMSDGSGLIDLEAELAGLSTSEALQRVSELLAAEMSRILKLPAEQIDKHRPLSSIGMDSLMALELRMAAEQRLGVEIPLMSLASGATLSDIARRILEKRQGDGSREKIDEDEQALLKSHVGESTLPDSETIGSIKTQIEERTSRMRKIM